MLPTYVGYVRDRCRHREESKKARATCAIIIQPVIFALKLPWNVWIVVIAYGKTLLFDFSAT